MTFYPQEPTKKVQPLPTLNKLADLKNGRFPSIMLRNWTPESREVMCYVFEEENAGGVLIYIPCVAVSDVFTKLEAESE